MNIAKVASNSTESFLKHAYTQALLKMFLLAAYMIAVTHTVYEMLSKGIWE